MARTRKIARKVTGGKAPRKQKTTASASSNSNSTHPKDVKGSKQSKGAEMSFQEFKKHAEDVTVSFGDHFDIKAVPKEFSTGSFGWSLNGNKKISLKNDEDVDVTVSLNITVKGTKTSSSVGTKTRPGVKAKEGGFSTQGSTSKKRKQAESEEEDETEEDGDEENSDDDDNEDDDAFVGEEDEEE